ncbi:MAG: leucine-rich repeat domain-containing protein [Candidatus Borkfalkiaceae bacterium]|nr:leucine-rich repeat domain-containing protein [Christensenellaceae bacterium]
MKHRKKTVGILLAALTAVFALFLCGCNGSETSSPSPAPASIALNGTLGEYARNAEIPLDGVTVTVTYSDGSVRTYPLIHPSVTLTGGGTEETGEGFELKVGWTEEGVTLESTLTYSVRPAVLTLRFGEGTWRPEEGSEGVDSYAAEITDSLTDLSVYEPTPSGEGKIFAGWFYDTALTERVIYRIEGHIFTRTDVTVYAGYDVDYTGTFNYEIDHETGEATLTSYVDFDTTELVVPATVELYPVTAIGDEFCPEYFSIFFSVKSLRFAEGSRVESIGEKAFLNVGSLTSVDLPEGLSVIGKSAFSGAGIRGEVRIPASVRRIESRAFAQCTFITGFVFPADSRALYFGDEAFSYCVAMTRFAMPDGLTECGKDIFTYCSDLSEIYIGDSLRTLGVRPFYGSDKLCAINVSPANQYYTAIDGCIYSKDMSQLVLYNHKLTDAVYTVPDGVKTICESAFDLSDGLSTSLKEIVLPEGLIRIYDNAFRNCAATFVLPSSLTSLSGYAFFGWKGRSFSLSSENADFAVRDGVLYSKDLKTLVCVPEGYERTEYVLPDSVETVRTGALIGCSATEFIRIGRDSNLKELHPSSLVPYSCRNLKAWIVEKEIPFALSTNACYVSRSATNFYFKVVVPEENFDDYRTAWEGYAVDHSVSSDYLIGGYLTSRPQLLTEIEGELVGTFGAFRDEEDAVEKIASFYGFGEEVPDPSDWRSNYFDVLKTVSSFDVLYSVSSGSSAYILAYEKAVYRYIGGYYASLSPERTCGELSFRPFCERVGQLPEVVYDALTPYLCNVSAAERLISEATALQRRYVDLVVSLSDAIPDGSFDYDRAREAIDGFILYGQSFIDSDFQITLKCFALQASVVVHDFLALEIDDENFDELFRLYYGTYYEEYYTYGIENYFKYYFYNDARRRMVYGYEQFLVHEQAFLAYQRDMLAAISGFDPSEEHTAKELDRLCSCYESLDYFRATELREKYVAIVAYAVKNLDFALPYDPSVYWALYERYYGVYYEAYDEEAEIAYAKIALRINVNYLIGQSAGFLGIGELKSVADGCLAESEEILSVLTEGERKALTEKAAEIDAVIALILKTMEETDENGTFDGARFGELASAYREIEGEYGSEVLSLKCAVMELRLGVDRFISVRPDENNAFFLSGDLADIDGILSAVLAQNGEYALPANEASALAAQREALNAVFFAMIKKIEAFEAPDAYSHQIYQNYYLLYQNLSSDTYSSALLTEQTKLAGSRITYRYNVHTVIDAHVDNFFDALYYSYSIDETAALAERYGEQVTSVVTEEEREDYEFKVKKIYDLLSF